MRKPLIGVCALVDDERESLWMLPGYMDGIEEAGGIPVMLPLTDDEEIIRRLAAEFDGFLFTGGHDVSPELYGEECIPGCAAVSEARDRMEEQLFGLTYKADKPVLGICRGIQFINAVMGGTLWQDLPSQRSSYVEHHQSPPYDIPVHNVKIEKESPLYGLLEDLLFNCSLPVNSYHHQAVKTPAPGLSVMAVSEDGLIEGLYDESRHFLWAVQWHPEFSHKTDEASRRIFRAFIKAAK